VASKRVANPLCPACPEGVGIVIKYGFFPRLTGHRPRIQRYYCKYCKSAFSSQTGSLTYRERKPHLTQAVMRHLMEAASQHGCTRLLGCSPITVARKMVRLGKRAAMHLKSRPCIGSEIGQEKVVLFDEMETFQHTKCKPISIALAVAASTREVVAVSASEMPATGSLSRISRERYGPRKDGRIEGMRTVMSEIARLCQKVELVKSDMCPRYPKIVQELLPKSVVHEVHKGRQGCVTGQGELKRGVRDPLFTLNHTCAMFRDRIKRLARRTWCTTKRIERLENLLSIYAWWHNNLVKRVARPFYMD